MDDLRTCLNPTHLNKVYQEGPLLDYLTLDQEHNRQLSIFAGSINPSQRSILIIVMITVSSLILVN